MEEIKQDCCWGVLFFLDDFLAGFVFFLVAFGLLVDASPFLCMVTTDGTLDEEVVSVTWSAEGDGVALSNDRTTSKA